MTNYNINKKNKSNLIFKAVIVVLFKRIKSWDVTGIKFNKRNDVGSAVHAILDII